jgi:hypothetical protein
MTLGFLGWPGWAVFVGTAGLAVMLVSYQLFPSYRRSALSHRGRGAIGWSVFALVTLGCSVALLVDGSPLAALTGALAVACGYLAVRDFRRGRY